MQQFSKFFLSEIPFSIGYDIPLLNISGCGIKQYSNTDYLPPISPVLLCIPFSLYLTERADAALPIPVAHFELKYPD